MTETNESLVRVERDGHRVEIALNRPKALNAINSALAGQLLNEFELLARDGEAWVVILRGAGERAFSAGADLKERHGFSKEDWIRQRDLFRRMFQALRDVPQPTIAAVQGFAFGGGAELALLCDCVVASDDAQFALPEARLGIIPGGSGVLNLLRIAGPGRAKEILFSGRRFDAHEALRLGVVQRLTAADRLVEEARALAASFLASSPSSLRAIKKLANATLDSTWSGALALEEEYYQAVLASSDRTEGIAAYVERREPRWTGR